MANEDQEQLAFTNFMSAAKRAALAFNDMARMYEMLNEEQRSRIDGLYPSNLKSMDEQGHDLQEFVEDFDEWNNV